ncbi:hypothetical protein EDB80DRAFT_690922 [Ilyonectria destructans]|nr:hypothetical protein EDB80DRAFT_690922 [Ilyonectria destructans]
MPHAPIFHLGLISLGKGLLVGWIPSPYYKQGRLENQELCLNTSVRSRHGEAEENIGIIMPSEGWQPEKSKDMGLVLSSHQRLSHRDHLFTNQVTPGTVPKAEEDDSSQPNPCLGSNCGTLPRELYDVGLIRAYTRHILRRSPSQDAPVGNN